MDKSGIPKTVMFGGSRRKVARSPSYEQKWYVIIRGHDPVVVTKVKAGFFAYRRDRYHVHENTFKEAVGAVEAKMLSRFRKLGIVLGYDVED